MNPNDHPHGGGEGRAPVGRSGPMTPWGKPALGKKTRKNKKESNKYIPGPGAYDINSFENWNKKSHNILFV